MLTKHATRPFAAILFRSILPRMFHQPIRYSSKGRDRPPRRISLSPPVSVSTTLAYSTTSSSRAPGQRLTGKVAVVTGASSGLGRAIALAFAAQGTRLVVCADLRADAHPEGEASTHEFIRREYGQERVVFVKTDVGEAEDVEACVAEAVRGGGRLDVMVNNAGLGFEDVRVHEMEEKKWDLMMRINLRGVFLGCKFACTQFLKQDPFEEGHRGWIVNMASGAGLKGVMGGAAAYCASKGAVVNFTRAVALDYASEKIHCNALCPGYTQTPMTKKMFGDANARANMLSQTPWGTLGTPQDVAKAAVFMASDDAAWITGVALAVDGGWAAG